MCVSYVAMVQASWTMHTGGTGIYCKHTQNDMIDQRVPFPSGSPVIGSCVCDKSSPHVRDKGEAAIDN